MNKPIQCNNTSGYTGVWETSNGKWRAEIWKDNKKYILGTYSDITEAARKRKIAEEILFQEWSYENSQNLGQEAYQVYQMIEKQRRNK